MSSIIARTLFRASKSIAAKPNLINVRRDSNYQAAFLKEIGKPLILESKKRSSLKKDQVRISVDYCSVNSIDSHNFQSGTNLSLPFIPGYELSGEVKEVGKNVTPEQVIVGERVAALSLDKFGGFAEECIVDVNDVWRLPSNIDTKEAAVLVCGHTTALYTFSKLHELKKDETVIISAGPAGLGLAAIDVAANAYKAKVIAVTDNEDRSELMRSKGAFSAIKFSKKLQKEILTATNNEKVNIVYDAVGESMFKPLGECLGLNGTIFHAAPVIYENIPPPPLNTYMMLVSLNNLRQNDRVLYRQLVSDVLEMADQGVLNAHVSAKFELKEINDAIEYIKGNKCTGKVLIKLD